MKPIETAHAIAERERKRRRIGGIIIIALLVLSTLGFALSGVGLRRDDGASEDGLTYNGQYWVYTAGGQQYFFTHHPSELTDVSIQITKTLVDYASKQIYIASEDSLGVQEIATNLGRYSPRISEACYGTCEKDLPEKECVAGAEPLIVVRAANAFRVSEQDNCVFIDGDLRSVDAFLYHVLGLN